MFPRCFDLLRASPRRPNQSICFEGRPHRWSLRCTSASRILSVFDRGWFLNSSEGTRSPLRPPRGSWYSITPTSLRPTTRFDKLCSRPASRFWLSPILERHLRCKDTQKTVTLRSRSKCSAFIASQGQVHNLRPPCRQLRWALLSIRDRTSQRTWSIRQ